MTQYKVIPRNLTARVASARQVVGNPVNTSMESAIANCFPGLEFDVRILDCRFFPGLLFRYVREPLEPKPTAIPDQQGARLLYLDFLFDPLLHERTTEPWAQALLAHYRGDVGRKLGVGRWYINWIEQDGKRISMTDPAGKFYDGEVVWRVVRSLEPGVEVRICLARRDATQELVELTGIRRRYVNEAGLFDEAFRPGEFTEAMCNPWTHDFRDCACHYWAASRPDVVIQDLAPAPTSSDREHSDGSGGTIFVDWLRARSQSSLPAFGTIAENRVFQIDHYEINRDWERLPFVLEGREFEGEYQPPFLRPAPQQAPFDVVGEIEGRLAGMEMTLVLQYLYALFSLRAPDEVSDETWPTLKDDLVAARQVLLRVAVGEMTHLRWSNQVLWELDRLCRYPKDSHYVPVVEPVKTLPILDNMPRALLPLTPSTLETFILIERPGSGVATAYGRCVGQMRKDGLPPEIIELVARIDGEGTDHMASFRNVQSILSAYGGRGGAYPYLRTIKRGRAGEAAHALALYDATKNRLRAAYVAEASRRFAESVSHMDAARHSMHELYQEGEKLARAGIGIPFWEDAP